MASSDVSSVTKYFSTAAEGFTTTLGSTIASGATSVPMNSTAGLTNGNVFVGIIEPGATAQQTFTGTVDVGGSQITNVVWVRGSNTGHAGGATIVDYVSGASHSMMTAGILKQHTQAGAHTGITTDTIATTGAATVGGTLAVAGVLTPTGGFPNNTVTGPELATNAITLGYASITSDFSTSSTTAAQITGLTAAVTIPAGGRSVKITVFAADAFSTTTANAKVTITIWDGTVGSGTQLSASNAFGGGGTGASAVLAMAVVTPSAGAKTYNAALNTAAAGTAKIEAGATYPAFILVEAI